MTIFEDKAPEEYPYKESGGYGRGQLGNLGRENHARWVVENTGTRQFCDSAAARFRRIKEDAPEKQKVFLFRVFLGDLIRRYACAKKLPEYRIVCQFSEALIVGRKPVDKIDFFDLEQVFSYDDWKPEIDKELARLCANDGIDPKFSNHNDSKRWRENKFLAQDKIKYRWIDKAEEQGCQIIRTYMLKNLINATQYRFRNASYERVRNYLNEWVDEAKVPELNEIDFSTFDFTPLEITTIARTGWIAGVPITKKGMRKRKSRGHCYIPENSKIEHQLQELVEYYNKNKALPSRNILPRQN